MSPPPPPLVPGAARRNAGPGAWNAELPSRSLSSALKLLDEMPVAGLVTWAVGLHALDGDDVCRPVETLVWPGARAERVVDDGRTVAYAAMAWFGFPTVSNFSCMIGTRVLWII